MTAPHLGIGMTSQRTRERLIQRLREEGIRDPRVLERIRNTPRHLFVDEALASRAYEDTALPIGSGQTLSQPYIVARMTEALLQGGALENVLEVGTGSGYQTAVLAPLVRRIARLEQRCPISVGPLPELTLNADADQIEQALINLSKNAAEAALQTGGGARIRVSEQSGHALIEIEDDGPGLAKTENLFVPFFTTKPGGSGVGLVLARQIVENHSGSLSLQNREDAQGCLVRVTLPL